MFNSNMNIFQHNSYQETCVWVCSGSCYMSVASRDCLRNSSTFILKVDTVTQNKLHTILKFKVTLMDPRSHIYDVNM